MFPPLSKPKRCTFFPTQLELAGRGGRGARIVLFVRQVSTLVLITRLAPKRSSLSSQRVTSINKRHHTSHKHSHRARRKRSNTRQPLERPPTMIRSLLSLAVLAALAISTQVRNDQCYHDDMYKMSAHDERTVRVVNSWTRFRRWTAGPPESSGERRRKWPTASSRSSAHPFDVGGKTLGNAGVTWKNLIVFFYCHNLTPSPFSLPQ